MCGACVLPAFFWCNMLYRSRPFTDEWTRAWECLTALWAHGDSGTGSMAGMKHGLTGGNAQISQLREVVERRLEAKQVVRGRVNVLNGHQNGDGGGGTGIG